MYSQKNGSISARLFLFNICLKILCCPPPYKASSAPNQYVMQRSWEVSLILSNWKLTLIGGDIGHSILHERLKNVYHNGLGFHPEASPAQHAKPESQMCCQQNSVARGQDNSSTLIRITRRHENNCSQSDLPGLVLKWMPQNTYDEPVRVLDQHLWGPFSDLRSHKFHSAKLLTFLRLWQQQQSVDDQTHKKIEWGSHQYFRNKLARKTWRIHYNLIGNKG